VIDLLLYGYLGGWVVASILAALVAWRLRDAHSPPPSPALLCVVAGAAWPILLVALIEAAVVALTAEVLHEDEELLSIDA
jgi:hypothetical protein